MNFHNNVGFYKLSGLHWVEGGGRGGEGRDRKLSIKILVFDSREISERHMKKG